ncbi:MAG: hypothetical protein OXN89_18455 [Bryobacterales bacterium]|nr:hypothetical protein [Bryobacterales bacterium]
MLKGTNTFLAAVIAAVVCVPFACKEVSRSDLHREQVAAALREQQERSEWKLDQAQLRVQRALMLVAEAMEAQETPRREALAREARRLAESASRSLSNPSSESVSVGYLVRPNSLVLGCDSVQALEAVMAIAASDESQEEKRRFMNEARDAGMCEYLDPLSVHWEVGEAPALSQVVRGLNFIALKSDDFGTVWARGNGLTRVVAQDQDRFSP